MKGLICSSGATCKEDRDFWKELLLEDIRVELIACASPLLVLEHIWSPNAKVGLRHVCL
jgi:hypothetical protein